MGEVVRYTGSQTLFTSGGSEEVEFKQSTLRKNGFRVTEFKGNFACLVRDSDDGSIFFYLTFIGTYEILRE